MRDIETILSVGAINCKAAQPGTSIETLIGRIKYDESPI
jgi:hypothetical protein